MGKVDLEKGAEICHPEAVSQWFAWLMASINSTRERLPLPLRLSSVEHEAGLC